MFSLVCGAPKKEKKKGRVVSIRFSPAYANYLSLSIYIYIHTHYIYMYICLCLMRWALLRVFW